MRHAHQRIVDDDGEVVGRHPVGAHDDRIADDVGAEPHRAAHGVVEYDLAKIGDEKSDGGRFAGSQPLLGLVGADGPATSRVACGLAGSQGGAAVGLQLLGRAEAAISEVAGDQAVDLGTIDREALRLTVRGVRSADIRTLVPVQS
jgi:hypothetical protein